MINSGWFIKAAATAIVGLATLAGAPAFAFPERPITMIVPWAPGGSTDLTGRVLARAAEKHLGQPIVILNKPGASTIIGMRELAQAKPDGYTIGTLSSSSYLAPLTGQAAGYDIMKDFTYVSYYGDNLIGIAVLKDKPWKSLAGPDRGRQEEPREDQLRHRRGEHHPAPDGGGAVAPHRRQVHPCAAARLRRFGPGAARQPRRLHLRGVGLGAVRGDGRGAAC